MCTAGRYARKHSPWVNFTDLPGATTNLPASALGTDWDRLPTVAFLTPDMCHDMHDCPVAAGDAWAKETLGSYLDVGPHPQQPARADLRRVRDPHAGNPIATVLAGPMVTPGRYPGRIDHYSLLRTIEDMYGLTPARQERRRDTDHRHLAHRTTEGTTAVGGTLVHSGAATRGSSGS